jgi:hypothetical protein
MKMSSSRLGLKGSPVTQHRPQYVDPPTCQSDECLSVPLALSPLALVEGSRVRSAAQACEGRLVEDPFESLVPSSHPFVVANPLTGVMGRRHQSGVGGELVGTREGSEVSDGHEELGPEDQTHAGQASEDPGLGACEKTVPKFLIEGRDAPLEVEHLVSELGNDTGGDILAG